MSNQKKNYKAENKSRVRNIIIDEIRKRDINSIVTLESPEFLFSKLLPDKKILVFEKDGNICNKLEKKAPKNSSLRKLSQKGRTKEKKFQKIL